MRRLYTQSSFSCMLIFVFYFMLNTDIALTSSVRTFVDSNSRKEGNHSSFLYSSRNDHERVRRASASDISDAHHASGLSSSGGNDVFTRNVGVALGVAAVFCLSSVVLFMCIFCAACDDDKSSDVGGANGYVGEINLADIQVIYNPSAGAPRLPYTHQNEAFKGSQEDIVLGNPAILQVSSCEGVNVQPSNGQKKTMLNQNALSDAAKSNTQSRRLKDVYVERENVIKLGYENPYTAGYRSDPVRNQTESSSGYPGNGRENVVPPSVPNNSVARANPSRNYFDGGRDYDMNDLTIKNMHVRY